MSAELEKKVNEHEYRIASQEQSTAEVIQALKDLTSAMNNQATQFAVYTSMHDTVQQEQNQLKSEVKQMAQDIAVMKPTVTNVNGLVWKVVGACLLGGGGIAAVLSVAISMAKGG